ncbi:hypothetical protein KKF84_01375 [Myxococcota bacterium]|nr:hypothetical protein [Myxococcota bacterium]
MSSLRATLQIHGTEGRHGWGVARHENLTVFLPGSLTGDTVECSFEPSGKKRWTIGKTLSTLEQSPHRRIAPCAHHPEHSADPDTHGCGGCPLMALTPEMALTEKRGYALRALSQQKIQTDLELVPHKGSDLQYRWRLRPRWSHGALGFNSRASDRIHPVDQCEISTFPGIFSLLRPLERFKGEGELRLTMNQAGEVAIQITGSPLGGFTPSLPLRLDSSLTLVSVMIQRKVHGEPFINLGTPDSPQWIAPHSFAQGGPRANALIQETLKDLLGQADCDGPILECYAGSGNLSAIARNFGPVTACEEEKSVREAFRKNLGTDVKLITTPVENLKISQTPACMILDPPRSGISALAMKRLIAAMAPRVILFSCDPMAGARDLGHFLSAGYQLVRIKLLDTMPNTPHFELVSLLVK